MLISQRIDFVACRKPDVREKFMPGLLKYSVKREEKMALTLYFLRHGQTALSREDIFCGSGLDPELTSEGMEMAQAFVKAYREAEWRAVYSSSLRPGHYNCTAFLRRLGNRATRTCWAQ